MKSVGSLEAARINRKREQARANAYKEFINEVAKTANELQAQQPGLPRSEALRCAERIVARINAEKS
jgi:hypothetical protein